ncbi:TetR/AcrR family transcriptional regulator [Bacillaceae bacterium Marseille-Q3522]|nr:TetR/AcrR family transcriptional regulator [Bacillaceae bacterium Marseille-Q3522]
MTGQDELLQYIAKQQHSLTEKQKQIIIAAIEIFSEKGYASTSTSEIAKRAGVAEGTIFRHFKTKKDLLQSIIAPILTNTIAPFIIDDLNKVLNQQFDHFEDFLREMLSNRIEFFRENKKLLKILIQEIPFHHELREQFMEHIGKIVASRFRAVILYFQEKGEIINIPYYSVIRFIGSTLIGYIFADFLIVPDNKWNKEEEIERTISFIIKGLAPS